MDVAEDPQDTAQSIVPGSHAVIADYGLEGSSVEVLGYEATAYLNAGACGSGGSVDVKLQESNNEVDWTDVDDGAFTQVTEANDNAIQKIEYTGDNQYLRAVASVATAACEFSISVVRRALTTDENDEIDAIITMARQTAELELRRPLVDTQFKLTLDEFPDEFELPKHPVQSVDSIQYYDSDGDLQTLSDTLYTVDLESEPCRIVPAYGESWPSTYNHVNAVIVTFTAGYGEQSDVPKWANILIKQLCGHYYEHRDEEAPISQAIERLIWNNRFEI